MKISYKKLSFVLIILLLLTWFFVEVFPPRFIIEMGLPEYARDLPSNFKLANEEFEKRIKAHFALPIRQKKLVETLKKDGFVVNPKLRNAQISKSHFPCSLVWRLTWEVDGSGSLTKINASHSAICL